MSLQDYIAVRNRREPTFGAEVRAAAAELAVGEALARRRQEIGMTLAALATGTGIAEERLAALDEGDSMTLPELLLLLDALEVSVSIEPDFAVFTRMPARSSH